MTKQRKIFGVSKTVFTLGIVSFLTDVSSEMLIPIIPQFLRFALGAPGVVVGLIEGVAESTASLLRVYAGYLADKFGRPKLLAVLGYGLSALSKPFLIFASSWSHVLGVRFADRFGKGIRSAPRDVLIADTTDDDSRGRAFGLHRAMDSAGAALGPLVVIGLVVCCLGERFIVAPGSEHMGLYRSIFIAAMVPALLGWIVLSVFVPEKAAETNPAARPKLQLSAFDRKFKVFLAAVTVFAIGNSSDAFLVLRATSDPIGMSFVTFLMVYVAFNMVQSAVSLRSGILSDTLGRKPLMVVGWLVFAVCYFGIARTTSASGIWLWFLIYGAHAGITEGVIRAYAVDLAPEHLRGTAIGAYYTFTGVAVLPASLIAGFLWDAFGPAAPFYYGAATSLAAVCILIAPLTKNR